jgi:hypothetical protein
MEWILGIAALLELLVVGVFVSALWQDRRTSAQRKDWEREARGLSHGEDLRAATRY